MNNSLDKALYYLTGNGNIDAVKVEELEKLVNNHPYFPVAHFLLSKKFKNQNSPGFLSQVQKTALYFPNPYWLHYQLLNNLPDEPIIHENGETLAHAIELNENQPEEIQTAPTIIEEPTPEFTTIEPEAQLPAPEHAITNVFTSDELEAASKLAHETLKENSRDDNITQSAEPSILQEPTLAENIPEEEGFTENQLPDTNAHTTGISEEDKLVEKIHEHTPAIVEEEYYVSHEHNETVSQPEEEMAAITRDTDETTTHFLNEVVEDPEESFVDEQDNSAVDEMREPEEDEHEKMFQNIKAMLDASSDEAKADVKNSVVPIDPYYTIDYFAAQGIKLDLEKNPQDKLGKQVKKFTQWLRHMKKLGPEDALAAESSTAAEMEAQQTADASNIAKEVVTEAMALVLEKQGKTDKAIQLYRKLTFLNPHKSAYFADKINHLNSL